MLKIKASKDDSEGLVGTLVEKMENFEVSRYSLYGKKVIEDNVWRIFGTVIVKSDKRNC